MRSGSHTVLVLGKHLAAHSRVVQQSQRIVASIAELVKPVLVNTKSNSNGLHDLHVQILADLKEAQHLLTEHLAILVKSVWPLVLESFHTLTTNLERLFQVGSLESSLFLNLGRIYKIGRLFTTLTHIATVGFWRRPCELLFLTDWSLEEAGTVLEGFLNCSLVDAVVADVDEACSLETRQDGFGSGFTDGRIGCLKGRKVDELVLSVEFKLVTYDQPTGMVKLSAPTAVVTVGMLILV